MQWMKIKDGSAVVKMVEMPDKSFAIGVFGLDSKSYAWDTAITRFGFRKSVSGLTLLRQGSIKKSEAVLIFGKDNVLVQDFDENSVIVRRKQVPSQPKTREEKVDTQYHIYLGLNYMGQRVMSTATGSRFIDVPERAEGVVSEDSVLIPPAFLRVKSASDLELCADGFVAQTETAFMRPLDVRKFCSTIYGEDAVVSETDSRLRAVQEAIEAASFRRVAKEFSDSDSKERVFGFAVDLNDRLPTATSRTSSSIALQQYSTPITLSIAAQNALGDVSGMSILEPTIGNASLVSALTNADITGVEIDQSRIGAAERGLVRQISSSQVRIIHGDFMEIEPSVFGDEPFDVVIGNPPFGGLKPPIDHHGLKVTRIDHAIMLKALESRKDDGRAVFIVGADREGIFDKSAGVISGGSEYLFNWLNDHYEIQAIDVSGSLYTKQGATFPVRMIAVGRRRGPDEVTRAMATKEFRFPDDHRLDVIKNTDELWAQSVRLRAFLEASSPHMVETIDNSPTETVAEEAEHDQEFGNDFQTQYIPMSNGNTSAMIPKNMVAAQQAAFDRFIEENGDPEEFVMRELKMESLDSLEPEQIDAIALGIWNMKRGRALILADQTGMGKGRIVAAIARWAAMNGKQTNFMTEKESLFSDFWRDIRDIGAEGDFTPFIMNANVSIVSMDGDEQTVMVPKTSNATRNAIIESGAPAADHGYNLMLSTYSQFNREIGKSAKSAYIAGDASKGAVVILDESHNASGESNTSRNITQSVINSESAIYSSATYAKAAKNMSVYYKAFPRSVNIETLRDTMDAGGEALQEIMSSMLCADGVLVRREHDLSKLEFAVAEVPVDTLQRNERISDQVSEILSVMAGFSGDVSSMVGREAKAIEKEIEGLSEEQKAGHRLGVSYQNFGSRLYNVSRQLALVLAVDQASAIAVDALQRGEKPVLVLENTFESIISDVTGDRKTKGGDNGTDDVGVDDDEIGSLTVKDILGKVLKRLQEVNIINGYGNTEKTNVFALAANSAEAENARFIVERIRQMINEMDDIVAMPIDQMIASITAAGYKVGEVSGRKFTNTINADGTVVREPRTSQKNRDIFNFNSGETDAIILTRSGCTGISLHASEKFQDQRRRVLIEVQIAQNVAERVQFFGRVNRRGQVSSPRIVSVTSGLPWEMRSLAMQNMKLRKLSANTQSNRKSSAEMKDVPDLLNSVGDAVCREYLMNNPLVAHVVGVDMTKEDEDGGAEGETGAWFANRLTGRICLLAVRQQEAIYNALTSEFDAKLEELTAKGINPFETRILDVRATVVAKEVVAQGNDYGSVFDAPVYAEKLNWSKVVEPIGYEKMVRFANESIENLPFTVSHTKFPDGVPKKENGLVDYSALGRLDYFTRMRITDASSMNKPAVHAVDFGNLKRIIDEDCKKSCFAAIKAKSKKSVSEEEMQKTFDDLVADKEHNQIKYIAERSKWLADNIKNMAPGTVVNFTNNEGTQVQGMVVSLKVTESRSAHLLGNYHVGIMVPGEDSAVRVTANALVSDGNFGIVGGVKDFIKAVESAPKGEIVFSRWVLTGNLFRAAEIAAASKLGSSGMYTTEDGARHRAIILNSSADLKDIKESKIALTQHDAAEAILKDIREAIETNSKEVKSFAFGDIRMICRGEKIVIQTPGSKAAAGAVFSNNELLKITGEFSGTRSLMMASFDIPENEKERDLAVKKIVSVIYGSGRSYCAPLSQKNPEEQKESGSDNTNWRL